ncbi:hypothetical protein A3G67_02625 [Candidatus Roizmanbacteria bacterium RIFCSPLOWO2_12_FULL_40_12]|uniref:FAD dependent oxidoreductase domain-containing protein n=1 Tax=Candidatus Roizmanbacteria bacterium RIFCSPLOWO2_01_FULL_40_42 TaxID=1802066 RepID=A0A1F7J647_9BACT|nr:MAG: hypothetical protein A2779_03915 [Candidatus Roizmanbacteria bacterium RIFCSPHIGHO2_01_FULL_40_98]OGK28646.1 MAG: hypothetical protein A3C31_01475 [Candidatus Roizmanbacteria bacterium RIFCSPHIGHO2_02_FULL_40_53]OGK29428.1 MAG: hypothetical protein A2W49_04245 [Candidatus Roizmanbacteria bacterium RIFCSPHIGHO2_12_41_18]OGK51069.1 MAG: hypothetical protein A3B50_02800 [Candidatus Roizmanbacteria bacterium RIFCSPLOWO2_01_FULL_40_42]OGK61712.1 MAG: hypothetical protein A3G67_02625 [Candida
MLREIEVGTRNWRNELSSSFHCDTVVIGAGVMGLLLAKKLTDLGQSVTLIEQKNTLAYGASIKNHGWLHRGTAHAVSIKDKDQAKSVVQKLIYGFDYLSSYARECIERPFEPMYAVTQDQTVAEQAVCAWEELGVDYEEIAKQDFFKIDPDINGDLPLRIFQSADLHINNRMLFQKLLTDIKKNNGLVIQGADFSYKSEDEIEIHSEKNFIVGAESFVYCTGANLGDAYRQLTGSDLDMSF